MSAAPPLAPRASSLPPLCHELLVLQIQFSRAPRRFPLPLVPVVAVSSAVVVVERHSDFVVGADDGRHLEQGLAQAF